MLSGHWNRRTIWRIRDDPGASTILLQVVAEEKARKQRKMPQQTKKNASKKDAGGGGRDGEKGEEQMKNKMKDEDKKNSERAAASRGDIVKAKEPKENGTDTLKRLEKAPTEAVHTNSRPEEDSKGQNEANDKRKSGAIGGENVNKLRGYLQVKHNPQTSGKSRNRLLRKVGTR